jgi:excisionase family DNA binding protein
MSAATQSTRPVESPYLTSREAMAYLRVNSLSNLYHLVREHRLPCLRRGNLYLFDTRELDAWLRGATAIEFSRERHAAHSRADQARSGSPVFGLRSRR